MNIKDELLHRGDDMKSQANRYPKKRTLAQNLRATFGRIEPPQAGPRSLFTLGAVCLLITGAASADWRVYDSRVETKLDEVSRRIGEDNPRSVNANLDLLNNRLDVEGETYDPEAGGEGDGGEEGGSGNKTKLAEAPNLEGGDGIKTRRCGGEKTPAEQRTVCEAIVQLEGERYEYLQAMREISKRRAEELKTITEERKNISKDEFGKLESNTNRLLALLTHQRIDELNLQMAMATYDERIRERQEYLNYLGAGLMNPRNKAGEGGGDGGLPDPGSLFDGAMQVATLKAALEIARARDR